MNNQPNLRRIAFLIIGSLLALFLLSQMWHYYHTGKIIITTDNPNNTITLTKTVNGQKTGQSFKAHNKLSVTVSTGQYSASVDGNSVATVQTINLKPRATMRYTINPINATGVEPVVYENAQAVAAMAHQLVYLDVSPDEGGSSNELREIDGQNNIVGIGSAHKFKVVEWAGPSFGVGQDQDGQLYTIANGFVSPLKVPFSYNGKAVNFRVSRDKRVYVSNGATVYAGDQKGGFKKIYTASSSSPALAATANEVAVSDSKYGDKTSNIPKSLLATINTSGKVTRKNVEAERLAWSPNGQYLAAANQANPVIYDAALNKVAAVPTGSVVGQFKWLNDTTLLYTSSSELWIYNLSQQRAQLLANMPFSDSITGLYISDDGAYVYVTTFDSNSLAYAIKRIGLKGQAVPDYVYKLQDIMPYQSSNYSLSLVNFSGPPAIIVNIVPSTQSDQDGLKAAVEDLQGKGFDTSKLRFKIGQFDT